MLGNLESGKSWDEIPEASFTNVTEERKLALTLTGVGPYLSLHLWTCGLDKSSTKMHGTQSWGYSSPRKENTSLKCFQKRFHHFFFFLPIKIEIFRPTKFLLACNFVISLSEKEKNPFQYSKSQKKNVNWMLSLSIILGIKERGRHL